jgi:hypothetical protein
MKRLFGSRLPPSTADTMRVPGMGTGLPAFAQDVVSQQTLAAPLAWQAGGPFNTTRIYRVNASAKGARIGVT